MKMEGQVALSANRDLVWQKLDDPAVLAVCIPACTSLERSDKGFAAVAKIKVGPIATSFKGKVEFGDLDPPRSYRIAGSGEGGVAGFAKGTAFVSLEEHESGCLLSYAVESAMGGKLAQLGSRLIDGVAKKMSDEFSAKFAWAGTDLPRDSFRSLASQLLTGSAPSPHLRAARFAADF